MKYITDRHLPDKAIDVIDEAGKNRLMPLSRRKKPLVSVKLRQLRVRIARIPEKPFPAVTKICCVTSTAA